jgi:AsmA protein
MKKFLIIAGALLLVVLIALVALPFFININSFRPKLEEQASLALGRKVTLGNLSLSLFNGTVGADDIEIADDPAFSQQNFISAKSVKIAVSMHPLIFERKIEVTGIDLISPQIALIKGDNGTWNFSSLGGAKADKDKPAKLPAISIGHLSEEDGTITIGELNSTRPPSTYDRVQLEVTDFSTTAPFHFNLLANLPGDGNAKVSGSAGPINAADAARSPLDITIRLNNVHISAYGLVDPAAGIDGIAGLDETMKSDGSKATIAGTFSGTHMKLAPTGKPTATEISVKHSIDVDLDQRSADITQADIAIGKAVIHATGTFQDNNGKQLVDLHLIGTDLPMDDLQSIVPALAVKTPYNSTMRGGSATAKLHVTGSPANPTITGHISTVDTTQVGFNLGAQLGSIAAFAGKTISSPDTYMKSMTCDVIVTRAGVKVDNLAFDIPSVSTGTGSGTVSPDNQLHFEMLSYPTNGMAGGFQKLSAAGNNRVTVPMTVTGPVEKPVFTADTKAATKSMVSGAAKGVGAKISGLFKKKPKDKPDSTQPAPK